MCRFQHKLSCWLAVHKGMGGGENSWHARAVKSHSVAIIPFGGREWWVRGWEHVSVWYFPEELPGEFLTTVFKSTLFYVPSWRGAVKQSPYPWSSIHLRATYYPIQVFLALGFIKWVHSFAFFSLFALLFSLAHMKSGLNISQVLYLSIAKTILVNAPFSDDISHGKYFIFSSFCLQEQQENTFSVNFLC